MKSALGRRLWIIVGGAVVLIVLLVFLGRRGSTARVAVADVVSENLSSVLSTNGKVEPVTPPSFLGRYPPIVERASPFSSHHDTQRSQLFALFDSAPRA